MHGRHITRLRGPVYEYVRVSLTVATGAIGIVIVIVLALRVRNDRSANVQISNRAVAIVVDDRTKPAMDDDRAWVSDPVPAAAPTVTPPARVLATRISRLDDLIRVLTPGMRSAEVRELQHELRVRGYFPNRPLTTFYGPITRAAVERYQRASP